MSDDVLITPASRKVEFFDSGGNIDGKIELDGSGNLNITSTGNIAIGDITQDIHVGDGTQAVDLVFDFTSSIYSVANQDLTIGKKSLGGNDITIDTPSYLNITTDSGYVRVGAQNTSWAHFYTDRARYYFNKKVIVDEGIIGSYNEDLTLVTDQTETRVTIKATDGNVGIGTTSPAAQLHVEQDDGAVHGLKVYRNDSSTTTSLAYFHDDSVYVDNPTLHVKNDRADQYGYAALLEGRVGIGITGNMVTQPDQVLHVEGSILVDAFNQGKTTLASNYSDGATSLVLTDSSTFNEKGTGTINGVEFNWTAIDHSTNTLTVPDLGANYTANVIVAADTGLFFREGHENDIQPSITIYDNANSGDSRDDLSINAYSAIRMQLNDAAELKLTDDKLSLTPGNEDVASFVFRNRNDLGMFESGYNLQLASPENVYIQIDSNNNNADTKAFIVQKNSSGVGGGTELFRVDEDGNVGINDATPSYKLDVNGDIRAQDDMYTDKLIASQGIRSSSKAAFNTMQMYYYDRQSMAQTAVYLRVPVGGSSSANPGFYAMPHAGQVTQVMYGFYGQTLATSGTDTWTIHKIDTGGSTSSCNMDINFANLNRIGTTTNYNILVDVTVLSDASNLNFAAGDILQIQRTDGSPIDIEHVNAQLWVTFDI